MCFLPFDNFIEATLSLFLAYRYAHRAAFTIVNYNQADVIKVGLLSFFVAHFFFCIDSLT